MSRLRGHHLAMAGALGAALAVGAMVWLWPQETAHERHLRPPKTLPEGARHAVKTGMRAHGFRMQDLVWQVILLDYESAAKTAEGIQAEPGLARPVGDPSTVNEGLPAQFFQLQDELKAQARALGEAAKKRDAAALADAFSALSQTCMRCHAVYQGEPR